MSRSLVQLRPLRRHYFFQIFGLLVLLTVLSASAGLYVSTFSSLLVATIVGVGISTVGTAFIAQKIVNDTIRTTEFLAQAILHVSGGDDGAGAPESNRLPVSQSFFEELATAVYQMASHLPAGQGAKPSFEAALLKNAPLPIYVLDKEAKLSYATAAGIEYAHLNESAIGQLFDDAVALSFTGEDTVAGWLEECASGRLTDFHSWDRVRLSMPDGTYKQCDVAAYYNKDNPQGVECVISLFDHTERYSADDSGVSVISMAVHELRTPLTVMRGYIEVFEEEVSPMLNGEQTEFMRGLSAQAQQLNSFVNNIQNFARLEQNELHLSLQEDDWANVIKKTLRDLDVRIKARRKVVTSDIPDNLPPVAIDKNTIYEVLVNLIENAIKYTHNDEPIVIATKQLDENWVETTITDKGVGIPDSLIGHLFDKFYRSHKSSKSVGGTGLGLYLSKAIVAAHGGEIWVRSQEGQGSTFGFTIPTFSSVANQVDSEDNKTITRGAEGWIRNHTLYRG